MAAPDIPPFDTQKAVEELRAEGAFSAQQVDIIVRATTIATANVVTKAQLESALESLKLDLQESIISRTWRFVAALIGMTAAMLGGFFVLLRFVLER